MACGSLSITQPVPAGRIDVTVHGLGTELPAINLNATF
jgi:hypothetical protein